MTPSARVSSPPLELLRRLVVPSAMRSLVTLGVLLAVTIGLGWLAQRIPVYFAPFVLVASGFFANGLVQLVHEAWHGNLFRQRWANILFGHVFALLSLVPFRSARHIHLLHHRHNRTERDPDAYNVGGRTLRTVLQFYLVVAFGLLLAPLHFGVLVPIGFLRGRVLREHIAEMLGIGVFWFAVYRLLPTSEAWLRTLLLSWFLPYLCATPWNGLKSIADHYANNWRGNRFQTATTVRSNWLFTLAWSGLNYHLDHHLYPRVPGYALPELHRYLAADLERACAPVFSSYLTTFWRAFWAGPTYAERKVGFLDIQVAPRPDAPSSLPEGGP
jgi:fatty acid desaturase